MRYPFTILINFSTFFSAIHLALCLLFAIHLFLQKKYIVINRLLGGVYITASVGSILNILFDSVYGLGKAIDLFHPIIYVTMYSLIILLAHKLLGKEKSIFSKITVGISLTLIIIVLILSSLNFIDYYINRNTISNFPFSSDLIQHLHTLAWINLLFCLVVNSILSKKRPNHGKEFQNVTFFYFVLAILTIFSFVILNIPNIELLRHYSYRPIFNTVNFGQLAIAIAVFLAYSSMTYQFNSLYRKFALFSLILIVMGIVTFYYIEESCERTAIIQLSEMDLYHTNELLANHPDDLDNLPDTILFILDYPFSEGVPPFYINPAFRNGYSGIWEDIQFNQANYNVLTEDNLNAYLNNLTVLPINSHEETIFTVSPENRVNHFVLVKSSMGEKNLVIGFSLNHLLLDMQNHLIKFTLIIGCGSLAVGVLFYIFLRTNLIQPLQNLLTGIEKVSRGEFENSRLKVTGYDEVSIISEAFNSLTRMIQQKESDLHLLSEEYIAEIKKTAEMQHTAQHYLALASIDYLTSIPNRRSFLSQAQTIYDSAVGGDSVLGFFMIDIDNFKLVNDRYGHAIGDLVLQRVAQSIKASLRNNDIVGRYGGEEFVILVNTISNEIVEQIAERIRGAIQEIKFSFSENTRPFSITISIGFTTRRKEDTLQAMIQRADEGLYVSKKEGKNRVTFIQ